jgi:hypothetical protein
MKKLVLVALLALAAVGAGLGAGKAQAGNCPQYNCSCVGQYCN